MTSRSDIAGAICSGLCLCHCLATPLVIAAGLGLWLTDEWVHWLLIAPVWWFALFSFPASYRRHSCLWPLVVGTLGVVIITGALFWESRWEGIATGIGGFCLVYSHLGNRRLVNRLVVPSCMSVSALCMWRGDCAGTMDC